MHDSIEADLLIAHRAPFARDLAAWSDAYITSMLRLDPEAEPWLGAGAAGILEYHPCATSA